MSATNIWNFSWRKEESQSIDLKLPPSLTELNLHDIVHLSHATHCFEPSIIVVFSHVCHHNNLQCVDDVYRCRHLQRNYYHSQQSQHFGAGACALE